ncbi:MAG TPA: putative toxin-antitoxin system toxin component, PIN family [Ktedonobacteraceae bacterium]|jgi:putative PIN family toxin of toxin-antitoxin system
MTSESTKLRVVVDTNLFVRGLLNKQGQPFALLEAWHAKRFTLVMSDEQRAELEDVLARPRLIKRYHLSPSEADALLALVNRLSQRVVLTGALPVAVRDVKDEMILASAVEGAAHYLITGDDDLLTLNRNPALGVLRIVPVRDFLAVLVAGH